MNDPFLRGASSWGCSHYWQTPHSTTGCSWTTPPLPLGLYILLKVGGSEVGLRDGQGCPEEHWDKTLMLRITGQEARDRGKRARANGPGNAKSSRELHPYSWWECAVSKVDLLGVWRILLHGAVWTFQPEDETGRVRRGGRGCHSVLCAPLLTQPYATTHCTYQSNQAVLLTYFPALVSLLRASLEMTWPQMSFMGGLLSEVCCLRIGQANTEWYQHFFPRSISIYVKKKKKIKRVNQLNGGTELKQRWKFKKTLTGSSSLCVQTPLHCLCSITCLMFMSTGKAIQPDAKL